MAKLIKKEKVNLLWSDEEGDQRKVNDSAEVVEKIPKEIDLRIWLEKKQRGGKTVSLIKDLPHNPKYFQKLAKDLKKTCGSGGAFKNDTIEVQGDCREKMKAYLEKLGFSVKLAGG